MFGTGANKRSGIGIQYNLDYFLHLYVEFGQLYLGVLLELAFGGFNQFPKVIGVGLSHVVWAHMD